MIERYQLRYFLAVVETGGFSRAAAQVNVTQSTLSNGIAKLERSLGSRLFVRNSKRVHLTPVGARLIAHAKNIEAGFNLIETSGRSQVPKPTIRMGILSSIPLRFVEELVRTNAGSKDPDSLELNEGTESDLASRLERRRIDVAITAVRPADNRFGHEVLREEGYGLAVWHGHPLAERDFVDPEELLGEVMLVRRHCEVLRETSRYFTDRGVRPRFSYRTYNEERAAAMVRARLGVTVAPDSWRESGVPVLKLSGFDYRRVLGLLFAEDWPEKQDHARSLLNAARAAFGSDLPPS